MRPHNKLAAFLLLGGKGLILLEVSGLGLLRQSGTPVHLGSSVLSAMVLVPATLLLAGCAVFLVGTTFGK